MTFLTHPNAKGGKGWREWDISYYNNRTLVLPTGEGLLYIRKRFSGAQGTRVLLRATACGIYRLFLNGKKIGSEELAPGWTDYRERLLVATYDLTDLCASENILCAEISPGWWGGRISFGMYGFQPPAFACELILREPDGTETVISTDESWEATVGGPIRFADLWDGELDDYTVPSPIDRPEAFVWQSAVHFDGFHGELLPSFGPSVKVREDLTCLPRSAVLYQGTMENGTEYGAICIHKKQQGAGCETLTIPAAASLVLDFGQNVVGRPVLHFQAKRGTRIEVFFAEMLNDSGDSARGNDGPAGSVYIKNYRTALARYVCIASGEGEEIHFPSHVFYGFRYLEITVDADTALVAVKGEVLSSVETETGHFTCNSPEINALYKNIVWGLRGNYLSIPTDCPQRDERLGWTGDTQMFCGAATYLCDADTFLRRWLGDVRASQKAFDGAYCDVVPQVFSGVVNSGNAAWGDAGVIVPYRLYLMYHDVEVLRENYDSMEAYMAKLETLGGPKGAYDDWLGYEDLDHEYMSLCFYRNDARLMAEISQVLDKRGREEYYRRLCEKLTSKWQQTYLTGEGLTEESQTAYLLAFAFDLIPEEKQEICKKHLVDRIRDNGTRLASGFVGTGILAQTLEKIGLSELAYDLLYQKENPSWLYPLSQGATTMWERWNSYTHEDGFGEYTMNSFNHYAYGAVAEWFFGGIGGILPDAKSPGFTHFFLRPTPDPKSGRMTYAEVSYNSYSGRIESSWQKGNGEVAYRFVVPQGSTATVELLGEEVRSFIHNGKNAAIPTVSREGDRLRFLLSEGDYTVSVRCESSDTYVKKYPKENLQ